MKQYIELKWNKIESLENKEDQYTDKEMAFLYSLSNSKYDEFRIKAAELLVDHYTLKGGVCCIFLKK